MVTKVRERVARPNGRTRSRDGIPFPLVRERGPPQRAAVRRREVGGLTAALPSAE